MRVGTMAKRGLAAVACASVMLSLAGCVPPSAAVGDAKEVEPNVEHDAMRRADTTLGLISGGNLDTDRLVLDALDKGGIATSYASVEGVRDPVSTAQNAVRDMVDRAVDAMIIADINITDDNAQSWDDALDEAREAGVAVALLNPQQPPEDEKLYAAALKLNDRAMDATPIDDAMMTIVRDDPHERELMVTTNVE